MDIPHWMIQVTIMVMALYSEGAISEAKTDDDPGLLVASLTDSLDGIWEPCNTIEACAMKKVAPCVKSGTPDTCKMNVWKAETFGCHECNGAWLAVPPAKWTECDGTDCGNMIQRFFYACSNSGANPNCQMIHTRFCDTNSTCYGSWSEWFVDGQECFKQCKETGFMTRKRTCMHEGNESSSCHEKAAGNHNAPVMIQNAFISCINKSCPTPEDTELTAWSQWMTCNARCSLPTGKQIRYKECVYKDGKDAPMSKCAGKQPSIEERPCFYNVSKCKTKITVAPKVEVTTRYEVTTVIQSKEAVATDSTSDRQILQKRLKVSPTQANETSSTKEVTGEKQEVTDKHQYQIIIIIVAVIACLIILAILMFLCCRKRFKKKRLKKDLKKRISIVALQAHSGLSDGGEFERLRKSTVTSQDQNAVFSQRGHETLANFRLQGNSAIGISPSRRLPKVPESYNPVEDGDEVPSHHVYEEMGLLRSSTDVAAADRLRKKDAHRSRSQTLATSRKATSLQPYETQFPHRHGASQRSHKKIAPAKPPRKSMVLLEVSDADDREVRDIPKALYESNENVNMELPAHRVSSTGSERFLSLSERSYRADAVASRSAPVSPYQRNMSQINNSSGVIIPVKQGLHWVMPAGKNAGVIYVPYSPIYSGAMARRLSNGPNTPLHAVPQTSLRQTKSYKPTPRPRTMGSVPRISVAEADDYSQHSVMHMFQRNSPSLSAYAEMRGVASDFDFSGLPGNFIHLHGTHNITPNRGAQRGSEAVADFSVEEIDTTIKLSNDIEIEEDDNGYLVPNSPRSPAIQEYLT